MAFARMQAGDIFRAKLGAQLADQIGQRMIGTLPRCGCSRSLAMAAMLDGVQRFGFQRL